MKTAQPIIEKQLTVLPFEIRSIDAEERTFTAIASDSSLDRHGERIAQSGWDLANFKNNPVILYGHDYYAPPVGKALEIGFDEQNRLVFKVQFADAETYPFADTIFRLYQGGYMRAFSVGFIPKDAKWDDVNDEYIYTEQELLEISAVTVPSNPNALSLAYKEGVIGEDDRKKMVAEHKMILKSLTEVAPSNHTKSNDEDEQVNQEVLDALKTLSETVAEVKAKVDELAPAPVVENNDPEPGDKPSEENKDGGTQGEVVTPEEAQKIIDTAVEKALNQAKGKVE